VGDDGNEVTVRSARHECYAWPRTVKSPTSRRMPTLAFAMRSREHESAFKMFYTDVCVPCSCNESSGWCSETLHMHLVNLNAKMVVCSNPTCQGVHRSAWMYSVMRNTTDCTGQHMFTDTGGVDAVLTLMNSLCMVTYALDRELTHATTFPSINDPTVSEDFSLLADVAGLAEHDCVEDTWLPSFRIRLEGCPTMTLEAEVVSPTQ
jgi:hypothetical protein